MTRFQKFIVSAYRYLAAGVLVAILSTGVGYALITVFYTANSSWAAPILISQTNERILQMQEELFRSQQAIGLLDSGLKALNAETVVLKTEQIALSSLLSKAQSVQEELRKEGLTSASQLAPLTAVKAADVARTSKVVASLAKQEASISAELAANLITNEEAALRRATLNSIKVSATESAVQLVNLERQVNDLRHTSETLDGGNGASVVGLELISHLVQMESQLAQVRLKLSENDLQVANKTSELAKLKSLIGTLRRSPYYRVTLAKSPVSFAFLPYANESGIKEGTPVYDCALQVFWCKKVGIVLRIYHDEEHAQHPLFRIDVRGFLVEMDLADKSAAKSRVVFLGNPPLLI